MAKKSAYKTPKMMVDGNGWHEGARDKEEEQSLTARGFRHVGDVEAEEESEEVSEPVSE